MPDASLPSCHPQVAAPVVFVEFVGVLKFAGFGNKRGGKKRREKQERERNKARLAQTCFNAFLFVGAGRDVFDPRPLLLSKVLRSRNPIISA